MTTSGTYSFSFGEKPYIIHNEEDLALIFELLSTSHESYQLHRYVIMKLDEKLMNIIVSYKGLLSCMKHLAYKNRFLLLVKIGDTLTQVVGKSENLGSLLAGIPEEADKIRLIKSIRVKGLMSMVHTPDDLGNIMEWIYGDGEKMIFEMLGEDFLRLLFAYGTDIYKVFHFLADENKDILADILGLPFIRSVIFTAEDFFYVLKSLSNDKVVDFIPLFTPGELRRIIRKDEILHKFLPKITQEKEKMLLKYIHS